MVALVLAILKRKSFHPLKGGCDKFYPVLKEGLVNKRFRTRDFLIFYPPPLPIINDRSLGRLPLICTSRLAPQTKQLGLGIPTYFTPSINTRWRLMILKSRLNDNDYCLFAESNSPNCTFRFYYMSSTISWE